jgi:signal transduction histidine kinase
LRELVDFYEPAAEDVQRTLKGEVEDGLYISGEPGLFTQAVSNLIENALKYTYEGGRVEVRAVRRPDGRIEIAVSDDGPALPEDRDRVLDRFVRLEARAQRLACGLGFELWLRLSRACTKAACICAMDWADKASAKGSARCSFCRRMATHAHAFAGARQRASPDAFAGSRLAASVVCAASHTPYLAPLDGSPRGFADIAR